MIKISDICIIQKKSKIKAGEGKKEGKYKFFTSSNLQTKYLDTFQYNQPALIFGTGGNASIHYCEEPFSTSTDCIVLYQKNNSINLKVIYRFFEGNMQILENGFKGIGLKHISKDYILNISLNYMEDKVQNELIDVFEKIDYLVILRKKQLEKLDKLVKSCFVEMFGDPVRNSKNLPIKKLINLGSLDRGRSKHRPRNAPELLGGKYPLIQTGEVTNSDLYITSYQNTYSELGLKQSKMWNAGTLCITIAANIAQTAILSFDACFPDSIVGFVSYGQVEAVYMHYWFDFFQKILESQAPQVAQKNINLKILSNLNVIVPNIEQQQKFLIFVNKIEEQKLTIQQSLDKLEVLKKALMQEYFG